MPLFFTKKREEAPSQVVAQSENTNDSVYGESKPEIRQSDFIDLSDPNETVEAPQSTPTSTSVPHNENVVSYNYGMGMPIDAVYIYMERDWESEGKSDALKNADITDMNTKAEMIQNGLARRLEMTKMKYRLMIVELESKSDSLQQLGLVEPLVSTKNQVLVGHCC